MLFRLLAFYLTCITISRREGLLNSMQLQLHTNYTQLCAGSGVGGLVGGFLFLKQRPICHHGEYSPAADLQTTSSATDSVFALGQVIQDLNKPRVFLTASPLWYT